MAEANELKPEADDSFLLACRAFELFTPAEKEAALTEFARLRYESVRDRLFESVHVVIADQRRPK